MQVSEETWQALDFEDTVHIWNFETGKFTSRYNDQGGICWTFRLLHDDLLQDLFATGQLKKTITLKLLLPKVCALTRTSRCSQLDPESL